MEKFDVFEVVSRRLLAPSKEFEVASVVVCKDIRFAIYGDLVDMCGRAFSVILVYLLWR